MAQNLHLPGPAVTVFGDRDQLDQALGNELERRGCSTHIITTTLGWLSSTTHAVIRMGTATGDRAMQDLMTCDAPSTRIVAVCQRVDDDLETARVEALWRKCAAKHSASTIWHDSLDVRLSSVGELATAIAHEIFEPVDLDADLVRV